jgi:hypothetical protein
MPENIAGAAVQDHRAIAVHLVESARRAAVNRPKSAAVIDFVLRLGAPTTALQI